MNPQSGSDSRRTRGAGNCVAHVFLRSPSGRSFAELGEGPLPQDLAPYLAPAAAREKVLRAFGALGFRAHGDELGLTISIEGPRQLFSKVFGVPRKRLSGLSASETLDLPSPAEVRDLVERIVLLPPPQFFPSFGDRLLNPQTPGRTRRSKFRG
jgi:hypothetical protein